MSQFSIRLNQLREEADLSMGELSRKIGFINKQHQFYGAWLFYSIMLVNKIKYLEVNNE